MLAVQQAPRMGSSQPDPDSDPFMPFGYGVDPTQEPLLDAPDPAPGAPLLSETDSKFLSSFFEDLTANQYNMPSFGEGLNFSDAWLDLPPDFMGTATSFGEPLDSPGTQGYGSGSGNDQLDFQRMSLGSHMMPPPPPPPATSAAAASHQHTYQQHNTSDEVLNAAATLLQNGSASRGSSKASDSPQPRRPIGPPVGHLRHQPMEEFKEEGRKGISSSEHDNTFTEWMFGAKEGKTSRTAPSAEYQWGSDANFNAAQSYTPDSSKATLESLQQEQLKCLECFEVNKSATTSRPNSPSNPSPYAKNDGRNNSDFAQRQQDTDAPPRKRRKSKNVKEEDDDDDDDTNAPKSAKKRKPKGGRNSGASPLPSESIGSGKRRKSALSGAKAARENLSEEQKRENHIRSEQKRRTLIKEGFDDLHELVPGLKTGSFSKSTTLTMAAEWLEDLLRGNELLAAQLSALEGR